MTNKKTSLVNLNNLRGIPDDVIQDNGVYVWEVTDGYHQALRNLMSAYHGNIFQPITDMSDIGINKTEDAEFEIVDSKLKS